MHGSPRSYLQTKPPTYQMFQVTQGLPTGLQTSVIFANMYLAELDELPSMSVRQLACGPDLSTIRLDSRLTRTSTKYTPHCMIGTRPSSGTSQVLVNTSAFLIWIFRWSQVPCDLRHTGSHSTPLFIFLESLATPKVYWMHWWLARLSTSTERAIKTNLRSRNTFRSSLKTFAEGDTTRSRLKTSLHRPKA